MDTRAIDGRSVLCLNPWCTIRAQQSEYLVHNARSDELHLIPPVGYYVIQHCDGLNSVTDILERLHDRAGDRGEGQRRLLAFLEDLVARGILELNADA